MVTRKMKKRGKDWKKGREDITKGEKVIKLINKLIKDRK